jgi:L-ascorbate metabolism protein UlaG (beta-lactamase superfamily)
MELAFFGYNCFRIKKRDTTLVINPFDPREVGLSMTKQEGDMVLYTKSEKDISDSQRDKVELSPDREKKGKELLEIFEPGEYEVGGILVRTLGDPRVTVIFLNGIKVCYLGDLSNKLPEGALDDVGTIDYLIVPAGDSGKFIEWKELSKIVKTLEPGVVVPCAYKQDDLKEEYSGLKSVDEFCKEFGGSKVEKTKKLKLKNLNLSDDELYKIVVLDSLK